MNPKEYVNSIQGFSRAHALEDFAVTVKELNETTLHSLEQFQKVLQKQRGNVKAITDFDTNYRRGVKDAGNLKATDHILKVLQANAQLAGDVEDQMMKVIPKNADAQSLDYKGANLLQYAQALSFATKFVRKLYLRYTSDLLAAIPNPSVPFEPATTKPELAWINANFATFYQVMQSLSLAAKNFKQGMQGVPELTIALADHEALTQVQGHKLDPFQMGLISPRFNPIYRLRMAYTDWQLSRYNAAKAERQALEYRIQALTDSQDGKPNPKLEEVIEYETDRLQSLNYKIAQYEEDVNDR